LTNAYLIDNIVRVFVFGCLGWWRCWRLSPLPGDRAPDRAIIVVAAFGALQAVLNIIGLVQPGLRAVAGPLSALTAGAIFCAIATYYASLAHRQSFVLRSLLVAVVVATPASGILVASTPLTGLPAAAALWLKLVDVPAAVLTTWTCWLLLRRPRLHLIARYAISLQIAGMCTLAITEAVTLPLVAASDGTRPPASALHTTMLMAGIALSSFGLALVPVTEHVRRVALARKMRRSTRALTDIHGVLTSTFPYIEHLRPGASRKLAFWLFTPTATIAQAYNIVIEIRDGLLAISPSIDPREANMPAPVLARLNERAISTDLATPGAPHILLSPGRPHDFFAECRALAELASAHANSNT
jgi:hypothetical protein